MDQGVAQVRDTTPPTTSPVVITIFPLLRKMGISAALGRRRLTREQQLRPRLRPPRRVPPGPGGGQGGGHLAPPPPSLQGNVDYRRVLAAQASEGATAVPAAPVGRCA